MNNIAIKTKDLLPAEGIHTIRMAEVVTRKAIALQARITQLIKSGDAMRAGREEYRRLVNDLNYYFGCYEKQIHNLITLRGRSAFIGRLAADTTYSGNLNYGAVGTGSTAPGAGDTQLSAEIFRNATASVDTSDKDTNALVIISFFYATTDFTNANVNEFGNFIDGSASANSGRIFSRILFTDTINKTAQKTLTVDCQYQMTSA